MKFNIKKMKKILICLSLFVFISLFSYTMEEDLCSFTEEYKQYICENIQLTDDSKHCIFSNDECIEQDSECSYYKGNSK